jgi:hypothetical protein
MIVCNNCGTPISPGETSCAECGNENTAGAQAQIPSPSSRNLNTVAAVVGVIFCLTIMAIGARFLFSTGPSAQVASPLPDARATPFPKSSSPVKLPSPDNAQAASEVVDTLNGWAAATRAHDLDAHINYYDTTLDTYFSKRNVSAGYVRGNRSPAFTRYHTLDVQLRNIQVTLDPSGMRATAIFDKTYRFEGDKVLSGSVQQLISLSKASGRWLITGEKDLRVYYTNK